MMYNSSCDDKLRIDWFSCNEQRFRVPTQVSKTESFIATDGRLSCE